MTDPGQPGTLLATWISSRFGLTTGAGGPAPPDDDDRAVGPRRPTGESPPAGEAMCGVKVAVPVSHGVSVSTDTVDHRVVYRDLRSPTLALPPNYGGPRDRAHSRWPC